MGEKYDGVRCIWNNFRRALYPWFCFLLLLLLLLLLLMLLLLLLLLLLAKVEGEHQPYIFLMNIGYTRRAQQIDLPQSHHAACTQSCTFLDGELWYVI